MATIGTTLAPWGLAFIQSYAVDKKHVQGVDINDASDVARALEPLAGDTAATLFGLGFLGAALLAAAIVPLSTAYSVSETLGRKADVNDTFDEARSFMRSLGGNRKLMGNHALGRGDRLVTGIALAVIAASVVALGVLSIL